MSSALQENGSEPVNLLSLDGGGIRGISELIILDEIMKRLRYDLKLQELPRPCEYFHLIGGTSTGGLIALLLGRFRMTTDEALKEYSRLAEGVFSKTKRLGQDGRFKATNLETAVKSIVKERGLSRDPDERMVVSPRQDEFMCRVFVCAVPSMNMAHPRHFRTYEVRSNASPNCKIWEAARATSAAPTFFKSIRIADPGHTAETFVDAGVKCNNPTWEVINEAREIFGGDRHVGCILSIGTGHPGTVGVSKPGLFQRVLPTNLINVLKNLATDCENVARDLEKNFQNIPDLYFRFSVQHGAGGISLEEWKKMEELKTHTVSYLQDRDTYINSIVKVLTGWKLAAPAPLGGSITLSQISGKVVPPVKSEPQACKFKSRPSSSSLFTGRDRFLDKLNEHFASRAPELRERRAMLLHGMGGAGKTQICLKFVELYEDLFSHILWIDASSQGTIQQCFKEIAVTESLIESTTTVGQTVDAVRRWLGRAKTEWLLIFDNADGDPNVFSEFIPPGGGGNLLFTSRNIDIRRLTGNSCLNVGEMEEGEAVSLLLLAAGNNHPSPSDLALAKTIVEELHNFALAIDQAGAYIANECHLRYYLELYKERRKELLDDPAFKGASGYGYALYGTWDLSFRAVQRRAIDASDFQNAELASKSLAILNTLGFLHHEGISEKIFTGVAAAEVPNPNANLDPSGELQLPLDDLPIQLRQQGNATPFTRAMRVLVSFSLVKVNESRNSYTIHPLVHSWIRERLSPNETLVQLKTATILVACSISWNLNDWNFLVSVLPHVDSCRKFQEERSLRCHTSIANGFSHVYTMNRRYGEAEELQKLVTDTRKRVLGVEHPDTLTSMNDLALSYSNQGRYGEAEELQKLVTDTRKRVQGVEHPDTLTSMNDLALSYSKQGRYGEAEELQKLVADTRKRVLGVEHPDTLTSMNDLALSYSNQGRYGEAEELHKLVTDTFKRVLGVEHPYTLTSMNNLALSYSNQGHYGEAEELQKLVTDTRKRVQGVEHPYTLTSMNNLALSYSNQGRYGETEELQKLVTDTRKRVLGVEHPHTLISMNNLVLSYSKQGRYGEAEELQKLVTDTFKRVLGVEHPHTLISMRNLAIVYSNQGRLMEAEELKEIV